MTNLRDGELRRERLHEDEKILRIDLPHGIGYVEIRTGNVDDPTGYPVVDVEVHSDAEDRPAEDGRLYSQVYTAHDDTITLIGRPGPKLAEQERQLEYMEKAFEAHNNGNHDHCPPTCPVVQAHQGH